MILNWRNWGPIPCFIIDSVSDVGEAYAVPRQQIHFSGFQSSVSKAGVAIPHPVVRSAKVHRARPASHYQYRMHPVGCWCWLWPSGAAVMQTVKQITTSHRLKSRNLAAMHLYAPDFGGCSARVSEALVGNQIDCL